MFTRLFPFLFTLLLGGWCACRSDVSQPSVWAMRTEYTPSVADTGHWFPLNELLGKLEPERHPEFVRLPAPYAARADLYLRREACEAFIRMAQAAQEEGIVLRVLSATRSFTHQKGIWERKWKERTRAYPDTVRRAQSILEYSAMPGASRHHWGTDVDLNSLKNEDFEVGGPHERVYVWLRQNAHCFGFCQPYTPLGANRPMGYREEKWHWSYLPLAALMLQQYADQVTDSALTGFAGAKTAATLKVVKNYVAAVDAECR